MENGADPDTPDIARSWKCRWISWRNRLLASPGFQDRVTRIPLLRRVARQRAGQLFDHVAGFVYSQILLACIETDLLDLLSEGPIDNQALARSAKLSPDATDRLLRAASAIGIAENVATGWWMLGQQGAALRANPGAQAMILHHRVLYADLADPVALLRADRAKPTRLSDYWRYASDTDRDVAGAYSSLMASSQEMVARQALAAHDFGQYRRVLDVGGGHGRFAQALAEREPGLAIGLLDLPSVIAGARDRLGALGLADRIEMHPGDAFAASLPQGYDCITLVRVLHDHDDDRAQALLAATRQALPERGTLVIVEPMAGAQGAEAMGDGYFGLYLWAMNSGRPRRASEYGRMLKHAGFRRWAEAKTGQPVITSLLVASA